MGEQMTLGRRNNQAGLYAQLAASKATWRRDVYNVSKYCGRVTLKCKKMKMNKVFLIGYKLSYLLEKFE